MSYNYPGNGAPGAPNQSYPQQGMQGGSYGTTYTTPQSYEMGQQGYGRLDINSQSTAMGQPGYGTAGNAIIGQQFVFPTVVSYAVTKKVLSLSKGDWSISDQMGRMVYKFDGTTLSIRDKRFLSDMMGNKILTIRKKLLTMHSTWQILAGDSDHVIADVKKSSIVQLRPSINVMLSNSTLGENTPDYHMQGNFFERNLTILRGAEQCAQVSRQITFANIMLDKDTFGVTIFPGVDHALILALIVIMDEIYLQDQ